MRAGGFFGGCTSKQWHYFDSTAALSAGRWYFVATTYDGSQLRTFVNGTASGSIAVTGNTCVTTNQLTLGAKNNPVTGIEALLDGALDDVRVYNVALTATQLQTVMKWAVT